METDLRFYIDNAIVNSGINKFLPISTDRSIEGYTARIADSGGNHTFGILLQDFHVLNVRVWFRMREFLRGLFSLTGVPARATKSTLYFGNYRKTPLGIHQGDGQNFLFVVAGTKRMRFWAPSYFKRHGIDMNHELEYDSHLKNSITLQGRPGDILYWPDNLWHIGEGSGELTAAITIHAFMEKRAGREYSLPAPEILGRGLTGLEGLKKLMDRGDLKKLTIAKLLNHVTGFGFARVPEPLPRVKLRNADYIKAKKSDPILCFQWKLLDLVISSNGHSFQIQKAWKIRQLIRELNCGKILNVSQTLRKYSRSKTGLHREEVRKLLEKLQSIRAIDRIRPSRELF